MISKRKKDFLGYFTFFWKKREKRCLFSSVNVISREKSMKRKTFQIGKLLQVELLKKGTIISIENKSWNQVWQEKKEVELWKRGQIVALELE